jgi:hypothetical protein
VVRLNRTRIGPVSDRRLAPGEWRLLTTEEVRALETAVAEAGTAGPDGPGTGSAGAGRGR